MKEYKTYWKKNGRKRNITWEAKLARYLERHTPLERIRHDLFKAFDEGLDDYDLYKEVEEEYSFYVSAIAKYVKLMPKYKDTIDNMKAKVTESYKSIKGE